MERCKHGLVIGSCATCRPQSPKRLPRPSEEATVHAAGALNGERMMNEGFAVVRPSKGRDKCGAQYLDDKTTFVHIDGQPNLWAIEQILARAPNLKTIQVIPSMLRKLTPASHLRLCKERGVEVVGGHVGNPWGETRIVSPHFEKQRRFLAELAGEQKTLFEELLALGFEEVQIASSYFCLNGEEYKPQRVLAEEYGYNPSYTHYFSAKINAVLCYLDPNFSAADNAERIAKTMRERVVRLRPYLESEEQRRKLAEKLGIPKLATKFPLARLDVFEAILKAGKDGRLEKLRLEAQNDYQVIKLRFGLDDSTFGTYRTLDEVGKLMGDLSRERIRQLEERALAKLDISED